MSSKKSTLQSLTGHIIVALQPLSDSFSNPANFKEFMFRLGWNVNSMPSSYPKLARLVNEAQITLNSLPENADVTDLNDLVLKIKEIYSALNSIEEAPDGVDSEAFLLEIGERTFEILLVDYLRSELPILYNALKMLGIIDQQYFKETNSRPSFLKTRFRFDQIQRLASDPLSILEIVYGWGTQHLNFPLIATHLNELLQSLNFLTSIRRVDRGLQYGYQSPLDRVSRPIDLMLKIPIFHIIIDETPFELALSLLELPPEEGKLPGIILQPQIPSEIDREFVLDDNITIKIRGGIDLSSLFGLLLRPGEITFRNPFEPDSKLPDAGFGITIEYLNKTPIVLFGSHAKSRLEMKGMAISLDANFNQEDSDLILVVEATLRDLALTIVGAEQDSLLANLLSDKNLIIPIPLIIRWSSRTGLHFVGGSGLSISLNPHLKIGGVKIDRVTLELVSNDSLDPDPNFAIEILASISGRVGPVSFSMDGIGLQLKAIFKDGNAGPFDIGIDILPPHGVGLAINENGVKGGGFISRIENQYSGVIDLDLRGYSIQAFVILKTDPSISLLFAIFSQFRTPIQLGAGWKITKIGGLIGINRTVSHSDIISGIRSGVLDSILFPENVIENAPRIIGDLEKVYPANPGQHLIGPAIRIAYGTPTLITGDILLILEFPSPFQLSLIGRVRAMLPNEKHALIQINLAVLGAIDFTNERLSVYGTLYDSKILDFTLSGDMAMSASWGEEKNFIFSIGGFNPRFNPPANFPPFNAPPLKRLNVALSSNVSLSCYLALTSNTLQLGARVDALFKKSGAIIKGFLAFDALVQFDPLYYVVDVEAGLSVNFKGASLCLTLSGFIEGPNPYRIKGTVTISIFWWDISIAVDETFGEQKPEVITSIDPWPLLKEALEQNDSWTAEHPAWEVMGIVTKESLLGLQQQQQQAGGQILHPFGSLKVSQKVVPLNHTLTKFGTSYPKDNFRFEIKSISLHNNILGSRLVTTHDYFAPAQFTEYDDSEKLTLKSYDILDSGVFFTLTENEVVAFNEESVSHKDIIYETKILENISNKEGVRGPPIEKPLFPLDTMLVQTFILAGAAYHNSVSNNNKLKYQLKHRTRESSLVNEKFVIVDEDKMMAEVPEFGDELSQSVAINMLRDYRKANPQDKRNLKVISSFEKKEVPP